MKILFILNDPPYGTERCYNALRLANALFEKGFGHRGNSLPNGRCRLLRP